MQWGSSRLVILRNNKGKALKRPILIDVTIHNCRLTIKELKMQAHNTNKKGSLLVIRYAIKTVPRPSNRLTD